MNHDALRTEGMELLNFKVLRMLVADVGPFRSQATITFTGRRRIDRIEVPADMFQIAGEGGVGKTTLFDCLHGLFALLSRQPSGCFVERDTASYAEVDILSNWIIDGCRTPVAIRLWYGAEIAGRPDFRDKVEWAGTELDSFLKPHDVALIGFVRDVDLRLAEETNNLGRRILAIMREAELRSPDHVALPTVLYFPSNRGFRPSLPSRNTDTEALYSPAHCFLSDGPERHRSLKALFAEQAERNFDDFLHFIDMMNTLVFTERTPRSLFAVGSAVGQGCSIVMEDGREYDIDRLGSEDRSLLQIYSRITYYSTATTLLLIDDLDLHLSDRSQAALLRDLLRASDEHSDLQILFSVKRQSSMNAFLDMRSSTVKILDGACIGERPLDAYDR